MDEQANPNEGKRNLLIFRQTAQLFIATIVAQGMGIIRSMVLPLLFSPAQLGVWNLLLVIFGYGANAHLGILSGMNKLVPHYLALGEDKKAERTEESVFWCNIFFGAILAGSVYLSSYMFPLSFQAGLRILTLALLVQQIFVFFHCYLRGRSQFGLLSTGLIFFSIVGTPLIITFAFIFGERLLGALMGFALSYVLLVFFWLWKSGMSFTLRIEITAIRETFVVGLPLILWSILDLIFVSMDRWAIACIGNADTLGYYALAVMSANLLGGVTTAVSNVLFTKMIHSYAATHDYAIIGPLYLKSIQLLSLLMALLVSLSVPVLSFVIQIWLPHYTLSIWYIYLLQPTAFFMGLAYVAGPFLVVIDLSWQVTLVSATAILLNMCSLFGIFHAGWGAEGIALATSFSSSLLCLCYLLYSLWHLLAGSWRNCLGYGVRILIPFLTGYGTMLLLYPHSSSNSVYTWQFGQLVITLLGVTLAVGGSFLIANQDKSTVYYLFKILKRGEY